MKVALRLLPLVAITLVAPPVSAEELQPFHAHGKVGPPTDGSGGTELGIILDGEIAQRVYEAMPGAEEKEPCTDGFQKRDGDGLMCFTSQKRDEYQCTFGILLGKGKVTFGPLTC